MPLIKVQTSIAQPEKVQVEKLLKSISASLSKHLSKPETYVMTAFEANIPMTFGGTTDPTCFVEIKNVGSMKSHQTQTMSQDFCQLLEESLGVPQKRIYIEFADAKGMMWGWNGSTFG